MDNVLVDRNHNLSRAPTLLPGTSSPANDELPPARIFKEGRSAMSSGPERQDWVFQFERASAPFIEPLMGWTGSDDPLSQIQVRFDDLQSAIAFAERNGWRYRVEEPPPRRTRPVSYRDRFRYELADTLRRVGRLPEGGSRAVA